MKLFNHTYKEKIAIKIYNFLFSKEDIILNYVTKTNYKCDIILITKVGIFIINVYDANGVLFIDNKNDPLWFVMPLKKENRSFLRNKRKNDKASLSKSNKAKANTIPIDKEVEKASLPNPYNILNPIREEIIKLIKGKDNNFDENSYPVVSIPLFNEIVNVNDFNLFNLDGFKNYVRSLKKHSFKNEKITEYTNLIKNNGLNNEYIKNN